MLSRFGKKQDAGAKITEEAVRGARSTVIEPELHRDLISLNMVRDLSVDGGDVAFTIMLTTPACPLKGKMESLKLLKNIVRRLEMRTLGQASPEDEISDIAGHIHSSF